LIFPAKHTPIQCTVGPWPLPAREFIPFTVSGSFGRDGFRMFLAPTSADSAWGVGPHLLVVPTPLPVELSLTPGDYSFARDTLGRANSGNVDGTIGSASLAGTMQLSCCFSEPDPVEPPKRQPKFLGNQD
jgi:hypothetical protein